MSAGATNNSAFILIVDDDQDDHFFLRKAINEVIPNASVESLYDGVEAMTYLGRCGNNLPDLIFLDLNMIRFSGKETLRLIMNNETLKQVPVIILTTSKSTDERSELMSMGASEFYSKPYRNTQLVGIVEEVKLRWLVHA